MWIDLTAPITKYGETPDITHMDLYYTGWMSPVGSLITPCVVLDLTEGTSWPNPDFIPGMEHLGAGWSVILRTGWERWRGTDRYAQSPSADPRLLDRLLEKGVCLILVDSPGVVGGAAGPVHNEVDRRLAEACAFAVENLVGVDALPVGTPFTLYCFPLQMSAQNSASCRVLANVPDAEEREERHV